VNVVPRVTTPIGESEAASVVVRAYHELFGRDPTKRALVSMLSLIWIETARGGAVKNNNLGNITSSETRNGDAWRSELLRHTLQDTGSRILRPVHPVAEAHDPLAAAKRVRHPLLGITRLCDSVEHR